MTVSSSLPTDTPPQPEIPDGFRTKILWVCEDKDSYDTHHQWMEQYGRVCTIELK